MNEAQDTGVKNKMVIGAIVVIAVITGVVVLSLSGGDNDVVSPQATTSPVANIETDAGSAAGEAVLADEEGVQTVEVNAGSYFYNPEEIRVNQGDTIRIILTNIDEVGSNMMHDFVIDELDVQTDTIEAGETTTIEFVATEAGEYEYYCSVGDHRAMGQVGTLIVE